MVRAHLIISGRVQDVGFRYHTRAKARSVGVSGWVRNLDSGEVEAVFEGEEESVRQLVEWCRKGPEPASVIDVKVEFEEYAGEFKGFDSQ